MITLWVELCPLVQRDMRAYARRVGRERISPKDWNMELFETLRNVHVRWKRGIPDGPRWNFDKTYDWVAHHNAENLSIDAWDALLDDALDDHWEKRPA